jgi:hypothetical protein
MPVKFWKEVKGKAGLHHAFHDVSLVIFQSGELPSTREDAEFIISKLQSEHGARFTYKLLPNNYAKSQRTFEFEEDTEYKYMTLDEMNFSAKAWEQQAWVHQMWMHHTMPQTMHQTGVPQPEEE